VTLLYPCPGDDEAIRDVLAPVEAFEVAFRESRRFDGEILYLVPEPAEPFLRTTEALVERFPDWPPYGGTHETVVPHLTVAEGAACDQAEAALAPGLPLYGRARGAVLLAQVAPERWELQARLAFGGG
jgi:hypothetical protein